MDRGTRHMQKARIRARLRQILAEEIRDDAQLSFACGYRLNNQAETDRLRRHIYRNEGKRVVVYGCYLPYIDRGKYRADSRRTRTLREAERMAQDARQWRLFGVGEGEEDAYR